MTTGRAIFSVFCCLLSFWLGYLVGVTPLVDDDLDDRDLHG